MNKQEFMAFSLPYGLIINVEKGVTEKTIVGKVLLCSLTDLRANQFNCGYKHLQISGLVGMCYLSDCKPILRPLSDLTKEIEHGGEKFVPIRLLRGHGSIEFKCSFIFNNSISIYEVNFWIIQKLIEWHFDIAGLIEKGEAIDVNTLEENPYK